MPHLPQITTIGIAFLVPAIALLKKRHDLCIAWIGTNLIIDIFNSQQFMNLTAIKIFAVVSIPYLISQRSQFKGNKALYALVAYICYLGLSALYFGHLCPWVDETGFKSGRDLPQWRSIIHLGSFVLECLVAVYLSLQLKVEKNYSTLIKTIIAASALSCVAGVVERYTQWDFYQFFTAGVAPIVENRSRGFNYEPRGLAQSAVYGILAILNHWTIFKSHIISIILIIVLLVGGFFYTHSTTAFILLILGLALTILLQFKRIWPWLKTGNPSYSISILMALILTPLFIYKAKEDVWQRHFKERFFVARSNGFAENFEVFDAAAVNFLAKNPKYILSGTGPGLISIPASNYLLDRDKVVWTKGITALPHMGLVLQIANAGLFGIVAVLLFIVSAIQQSRRMRQAFPAIVAMLYCLQIRLIVLLPLSLILIKGQKDQSPAERNDLIA